MVIIVFPCIALAFNNFPISFSIPELKGFNFRGGLHLSPELIALTFALGIYTAAFIAEIGELRVRRRATWQTTKRIATVHFSLTGWNRRASCTNTKRQTRTARGEFRDADD